MMPTVFDSFQKSLIIRMVFEIFFFIGKNYNFIDYDIDLYSINNSIYIVSVC